MKTIIQRAAAALLLALAAACGGPQGSPDDEIATRVAVEQAVAATLTAEAPSAAPTAAPAPPTAAPTLAPAPPTPAPTLAPAATAAPPPTAAPAPPSPAPTAAPPPTPERTALAIFPPGGTSNGLIGQITVAGGEIGPGFDANASESFVVVRGSLSVRAEASDPERGEGDSAGIVAVVFSVNSLDSGGTAYTRSERNAPYCLLGDEGSCFAVALGPGATWPDGSPISPGRYFVQIEVEAEDPARSEFWFFQMDLQF